MALPRRNKSAAPIQPQRTERISLKHAVRPTQQTDAEPVVDEPALSYDDGSEDGAYEESISDDDVNMLDESYDNALNEQAPQYSSPQPIGKGGPQVQSTQQKSYQQPVQRSSPSSKKNGKRDKYDRKKRSQIKQAGMIVSRGHARAWRYTFLAIFIIMALLMIKNVVLPQKQLTASDVDNEVYSITGTSAFPLTKGATIAQGFAAAYISVNGNSAYQSILQNYYTGSSFKTVSKAQGATDAMPSTNGGDSISQSIQSGPYVYSEKSTSNTTANYVVGALVYRTVNGVNIKNSTGDSTDYRWIYLNVGIVYDPKSNKYAIDKTSPTLMNAPATKASSSLPQAQLPGDGTVDQDVTNASKDVVTNFMKAWAASDTSSLSTLVAPDRSINTMNGLNNRYVIKESDDLEENVYGLRGDTLYRALVTVTWTDNIQAGSDGSQDSIAYKSQYIVKLEKTSDGKYLVQDINPYYYVANTND